MQANATTQTENLQLQTEMVSIYEEKIVQIKDEFQTTIDSINLILEFGVSNYEKQCSDVKRLNDQLNAERLKNKELKQKLKQLKTTMNTKNTLITKLEQEIVKLNENKNVNMNMSNGSESEDQLRKELKTVKGMLAEMIAYEKYVLDIEEQEKKISTLSEILIDCRKINGAAKSSAHISNTLEKEDRFKIEIEVLKHKLNAHIAKPIRTTINETEFKKMSRIEKKPRYSSPIVPNMIKNTIKFHNWTNLMKSEFENSALILKKVANRLEAKIECSMDNDEKSLKSGEVTQQDLLMRQSDKIKSLKYQIKQEKGRAEKIFAHKTTKFEQELNKEKACRDRVKSKLEIIIRKNREVINELSDAQKK